MNGSGGDDDTPFCDASGRPGPKRRTPRVFRRWRDTARASSLDTRRALADRAIVISGFIDWRPECPCQPDRSSRSPSPRVCPAPPIRRRPRRRPHPYRPASTQAAMDKSVAPGRRLQRLRQRRMAQGHADSRRTSRRTARSRSSWTDTRKQTVDLIQDPANAGPNASARCAQGRRLLRELHGRSRHRGQGHGAAEAAARRDRGDRRQAARSRRAIGGTLRADVDPLNDTNFQTEHLFGVLVAQGLNDPVAQRRRTCCRAASALPDRDYYVSTSPQMAELRDEVPGATSQPMLKLAGVAGRRGARRAHRSRSRRRLPRVHATRVESQDVHEAAGLDARRARLEGARARLGRAARRRRPERTPPRSSSGIRRR